MSSRSENDFSMLAGRLRDIVGSAGVTEQSARETRISHKTGVANETETDFSISGIESPLRVQPDSVDVLAAVLALAQSDGLGVCVAGGATKLAWGNPPERFDVLLHTRGLRTQCTVDADDLTMTASAGLTLAEAQSRARTVNRLLPLDSGDPARATVGGIVATGDQGPRGAQYGRVRDLVLGLKATLADGTPVAFGGRTMKNVAGYDMTRLFSGSFGALGVITEATLRLLPLAAAQGLLASSLSSLAQGQEAAAKILDSPLQPLALEVASPRLARVLAPSLPSGCQLDVERPLFLAAFAGHAAAVERSLADVCRWLGLPTQKTLGDAEAEAFLERLAHFSAATAGRMPWPGETRESSLLLAARALVPVGRVWALAQTAESLAKKAGLLLAFRIGAARGALDLWLHPQPTSDPRPEPLAAWVTDLRNKAVDAGGQLMVTSRPALLPAPVDSWTDPGPALQLMRRLKERFDPQRTLNPGRFVGGL